MKIFYWNVGENTYQCFFLLSTGEEPSPAGKNQRSIEFVDFHSRKGVNNFGRA